MNPYSIYWDVRGHWVFSRQDFVIERAATLFDLAIALIRECLRVNAGESSVAASANHDG